MSYKELQSDGNGEFNTPLYLFNYLHRFFEFQIDPCDSGNRWLNLPYTLNKRHNGLEYEWDRNTFVNLPYGNGNENNWITKVFREYNKYDKNIFILLPAKTESNWFSTMMIKSDIILFPRPRISFVKNNKVQNGNNIGSVIFGLITKYTGGTQYHDFVNYNIFQDSLGFPFDRLDNDRYILFPDLKVLKEQYSTTN